MNKTRRKHTSARKSNHRKAFQKRVLTILVMAMAMIFVFCGFSAMGSTGQHDESELKYEVVIVDSGDSLWSIAKSYASHSEDSVKEYIKNLKKMNHIHGDQIQEGDAIVVYFYPE